MSMPRPEPIEGGLALWIPRTATISCMGLSYWLASRNEGLQGVQALLFPFFGSDEAGRSQTAYLVCNLASPVFIWTVESSRQGISTAKLLLQCLGGAAVQISGINRIAPIYYLLSMATWESEPTSQVQNMPPEVAEAVLPATVFDYLLPATLISLVPLTATGVSRSYLNIQTSVVYAFLSAPVTVPVLTKLISNVTHYVNRTAGRRTQDNKSTPDATNSHQCRRIINVSRSLRRGYAVLFAVQAAQHIYTIARNVIRIAGSQRSLAGAISNLLTRPMLPGQKYPSIVLYAGATLCFGLYTVWELRRRGMASNTDTKRAVVGVLTGQVLFGPGAAYAGLWWWREGVLVKNAMSGIRTI